MHIRLTCSPRPQLPVGSNRLPTPPETPRPYTFLKGMLKSSLLSYGTSHGEPPTSVQAQSRAEHPHSYGAKDRHPTAAAPQGCAATP